MTLLGSILIVLSLPLLIGYQASDQDHRMWLRLGGVLLGTGMFITALDFVQ